MILSWVAAAFAARGAVLVLPASGGPDEATLERIAAAAGHEEVRSVGAAAFVRGVVEVPMTRSLGEDCGAPVSLASWRKALGAAQRRFDLFDTEGALSDLVSLEVELECGAEPIPARDLFALDVARAEAHLLLGAAAGDDDERAAFHASAAIAAVDRAVAASPDRYPEAASPELVDVLEEARARHGAATGPWLAVTGLAVGEAAWINGVEVQRVVRVPVGDSIVLRVHDGEVVGARRVQVGAGDAVLVDFGDKGAAVGDLVAGLVRKVPSRADQARLAAVALLRGGGDDVLYAGWAGGRPVAWLALGADLVRLDEPSVAPREPEPERPPPRVVVEVEPAGAADVPDELDRWRATAGVHLGGGWFAGAGQLEAGLVGRVALAPRWSLAFGVVPTSAVDTLDPGGDGVQVEVPVRVGGRWGETSRRGHPEVGIDLGARLGATVEPLAAACGAWAGGSGRAGGVRLEVCVESDFADVGVRGGLGVESWI